jgi:pyruvate kinase|tara:strand:- start:604 stop:2031 length:1428 start_codon:yes stop_codon:yes gene_type:complete
MIRMKKTKIVATLGPASSSAEELERMMKAGMNVARLNFSHGEHENYGKVIQIIRDLDVKLNIHTAILADLQGPKIRTDIMAGEGALLKTGDVVEISTNNVEGTAKRFSTNYQSFAQDVKKGEKILLDDGKIHLEVESTNGKDLVKAKISHGGLLTSRKGINLPNTAISLPCLTPKDLKDLDYALSQDVDWVGLSFVRNSADIKELRKIIESQSKHARIVAKIEKPEAVADIDAIIKATDAIMVARGDLGVEIPMQNVPLVQKMLAKKCIKSAKPCIVATQMMESMIDNITPTRAEVNDVANAVMDGADAVMLSGETSVGKHPHLVIEAMNSIVVQAETHDSIYNHEEAPVKSAEARFITDSVCYNAVRLGQRVGAQAIITMSHSGYTGIKVASQRPNSDIFVFTGNRKILTLMSLVWGVRAFYYNKMVSTDHTIADIKYILKKWDMIQEDDFIINIASMPIAEMGMSNMVKLSKA